MLISNYVFFFQICMYACVTVFYIFDGKLVSIIFVFLIIAALALFPIQAPFYCRARNSLQQVVYETIDYILTCRAIIHQLQASYIYQIFNFLVLMFAFVLVIFYRKFAESRDDSSYGNKMGWNVTHGIPQLPPYVTQQLKFKVVMGIWMITHWSKVHHIKRQLM